MTGNPKQAPDLELQGTGGARRLRPASGGHLLVVFYQEDGTPTCTTELCSFREDFPLLEELGAEVVGISVNSLSAHAAFLKRIGGLPFPLLSDQDGAAARAFGVWDGETRRAMRAVFVIDAEGAILHARVPYNPANLGQYEAVFRSLGLSG
jgi:peroxiredoxin Q/BCP